MMCEFPYHTFDKKFVGKIGLANKKPHAFKGDLILYCSTSDEVLKKDFYAKDCPDKTPKDLEDLMLPVGMIDYTKGTFKNKMKLQEDLSTALEIALYGV